MLPLSQFQHFSVSAFQLFPLSLLWLAFIVQLGAQWSFFEQYNYGWAVPFLCLYLLWQRSGSRAPLSAFQHFSVSAFQSVGLSDCQHFSISAFQFQLSALCFLLVPLRLIHEANPQWRLTTWAWAILLVTLTLWLLWRTAGTPGLRRFGPPIAFFLVAVPWPSLVEAPIVQGLMRLNVAITAELLHLTGVPVIQRGNILELATGLLNVEEACSGIRSLQAALMLSLFFALYYRLNRSRLLALCLLAPVLTFTFNLLRTFVLSSVAARTTVQNVAAWHDPASVTILVACFLSLWLIARALRPLTPGLDLSPTPDPRPLTPDPAPSPLTPDLAPCASRLPLTASPATPAPRLLTPLVLLVTLLAMEIGVPLWYRVIESRQPPITHWTLIVPTNNPAFEPIEFPAKTKQILRYDESANFGWTDPDGARWQIVYLRWDPGRITGYLAKLHTPDICIPAAGLELTPLSGLRPFHTRDLTLQFRMFQVKAENQSGFVFYTRYGAGGATLTEEEPNFDRWQRLRSVLKGRGSQGMQVLEIALWGFTDEHQALSALQSRMAELVAQRAKPLLPPAS